MIRYTQGNLLDASAEALVNTVNEVGVMGKGVALMFRERFPENARVYVEASKAGQVRVGRVLVTPAGELFPKWIVHFPTKKHWRNPSRLEWVRDGLDDLVRVAREMGIGSIALPPLGCGNGGLDWQQVRPMIESAFAALPDVEVIVFEPTGAYHNPPKRSGVEKLTPARALVTEIVRRYSVLGLDCTILEVQKLAYFLQRSVTRLSVADPLDLRFAADKYGPYADRLRHLLDGLDGSYLHAEKRLSDARPMELIWFESAKRPALEAYLADPEAVPFLPALERTAALIDGFESPLGMELLATVDWLIIEQSVEPTVGALREALASWPAGAAAARRKLAIFDERLLQLALDRLATAA
ncbi:MAG TPA: macro domain-containing protein [Longimicrobium sp.]|nr:macro domain-containing protein [Longimicrobium sp.]